MERISAGMIGVDQGSAALFSHYASGGEMWTGEGAREIRQTIAFSEAFRSVPAVHVSLALFDLDQQTNPRADLCAENITKMGFDAVFRTWSDTRVARIRISWIAIGPVVSEDDWDIS